MGIADISGMSEFLDIFGSITIQDLFHMALAVGFVLVAINRLKVHLLEKQRVENDKMKRMDEIAEAITEISVMKTSLAKVENLLTKSIQRLDIIEENARNRERASFKDRLLQSYRYFTSRDHNPLCQWTRMEADAFNDLYDEYMSTGDDEQVRREVRPAVDSLGIIEMHDQVAVSTLMQSRK